MHEAVAAQLAPAENLPCADEKFLGPLKASAEFASIHVRLVSDHHIDSWLEDGLHFFVFQLNAVNGPWNGHATAGEPPVAVFVMHADQKEPVSAVVVTPLPDSEEAEIQDLRDPDTVYEAPISP
jgi:hypothetical protein